MTNNKNDEHYFLVKGRKWRRTDPNIPKVLCSQLTKQLMTARRSVKTALASGDSEDLKFARDAVHDAKVALGERGPKWWESYDEADLQLKIRAAIKTLLRHRALGKTICPSEAARAIGGSSWRDTMPIAIDVAWNLDNEGWLNVVQKGSAVSRPTQGPIRLRRRKDSR